MRAYPTHTTAGHPLKPAPLFMRLLDWAHPVCGCSGHPRTAGSPNPPFAVIDEQRQPGHPRAAIQVLLGRAARANLGKNRHPLKPAAPFTRLLDWAHPVTVCSGHHRIAGSPNPPLA
eukprot:11780058-Karenia_brevis.AAC.1